MHLRRDQILKRTKLMFYLFTRCPFFSFSYNFLDWRTNFYRFKFMQKLNWYLLSPWELFVVLIDTDELAAFRWRSKYGRPSKVPTLGEVDPTGTYCEVPEDWLLRKYGTRIMTWTNVASCLTVFNSRCMVVLVMCHQDEISFHFSF